MRALVKRRYSAVLRWRAFVPLCDTCPGGGRGDAPRSAAFGLSIELVDSAARPRRRRRLRPPVGADRSTWKLTSSGRGAAHLSQYAGQHPGPTALRETAKQGASDLIRFKLEIIDEFIRGENPTTVVTFWFERSTSHRRSYFISFTVPFNSVTGIVSAGRDERRLCAVACLFFNFYRRGAPRPADSNYGGANCNVSGGRSPRSQSVFMLYGFMIKAIQRTTLIRTPREGQRERGRPIIMWKKEVCGRAISDRKPAAASGAPTGRLRARLASATKKIEINKNEVTNPHFSASELSDVHRIVSTPLQKSCI
ncbi:hypothetical protein EVAR_49994_1 [Eumeta japonica]|uniref:Uncharacterized protein n=1 Tax=Eumeta variegata TaxID=151549 RepID=A0A4C1XSM7_EUMVA|nr:hypothetical protein EVAR_49994_1 [Eumeta japonica]